MFLPVLWLVFSSFKTQAGLLRFPPDLLPYDQKSVVVEGYEQPLPLYNVTMLSESPMTERMYLPMVPIGRPASTLPAPATQRQ